MFSESLNFEIWDRLIQGKSMEGLDLGEKCGRIDLSGLKLPEPSIVRRFQVQGAPIAEIDSGPLIACVKWRDLDFSNSKLNGLRFFQCELDNCKFERCNLQDWRVWDTAISKCSFKGANLKKSSLGGVVDGKRNRYSEVNFSDADLRETVYKAAAFERCDFRNAKLVKIDFQTSTFTDCVFEGELRDVLFYRRGFEGDEFPPNEMANVDFSCAKLRDVGFRGLALDRVKLPRDADHIFIRNVPTTLDRLVDMLKLQGDTTAKQLAAFLNIDRKWIPSDRVQGVINIQDLEEVVGAEGVTRLRELLK